MLYAFRFIFTWLFPRSETVSAKIESTKKDTSGWMVCSIRVPYADTDRAENVYYGQYLVYFEIARNELMRDLGFTYKEFEAQGYFAPIAQAHLDYKARAFYDDVLEIWSTVQKISDTRIRVDYRVFREGESKPLVTGYTIHAVVTDKGKPVKIPEVLADLIEKLPAPTEVK